jgi:nucleotide-binding universal stress UspA family protein
MFKHVLIATDGSPLSDSASRSAVKLAKSLSAQVTAITVSTPFHAFTSNYVMLTDTEDGYNDDCERRARSSLDVVGKAAESAGVAFHGMHVFHEHPYAAIIEAADEKGCDVICMASHGRKGTIALVVGSETMKVLTHSKIPVVVWR